MRKMGSHQKSLLAAVFGLLAVVLVCSVVHGNPPHSCDPSNLATRYRDFCKTSLPISRRVDDLIYHLTLEEKISQLGDEAPAIPRLGIPAYYWWSESLHGVSNSGKGIHFNGVIKSATSFPQVILTAATFNPLLWYRIGQAIGTEGRAVYNAGQATGLTFWSPNINIFRDPRWGRGQETPGEDPTMTSKYAVSFVRGLQGEPYQGGSMLGLKASGCCKHFTAYDLEKWGGKTRFGFDARVSAQDMEDTYQPPFKSCVEQGHANGIMCSYNRVNGVPTCADYNLLSKTARGSWGFNGYIVSDCDAVSIIHDVTGFAKTPEDAVADVLKAGMDVNCGTTLQNHTRSAYYKKKVTESDINRALHNLFTTRIKLGLFDGNPLHRKYGDIKPDQVCTKEHQHLALEVARDGIVLLKNSGHQLPLSKSATRSLGVIGPNANNGWLLLGNYAGPPCNVMAPLHSLKNVVRDVRYLSGCDKVACSSASTGEAASLASSVDQVVLFMGLDQTQETEGLDRTSLVLPGQQQNLITSVAKAAKSPVILVLICGGPVDVTFAKYNDKIGAILWAGYPGEAGGLAITQVIFGEHSPSGRLPVTWYPQEFTKVAMTDMRMRPDLAKGYPGRTYRFYKGRTVFNFGFGLSYSTYTHEFVSVTRNQLYVNRSAAGSASYAVGNLRPDECRGLLFSADVGVQNVGKMGGKHSVLLFLKREDGGKENGSPVKELIGFENVYLHAGERTQVRFELKPCEHFGRSDVDGSMVLDGGGHSLIVEEAEHRVHLSFI